MKEKKPKKSVYEINKRLRKRQMKTKLFVEQLHNLYKDVEIEEIKE
jgi:hypothetical protein